MYLKDVYKWSLEGIVVTHIRKMPMGYSDSSSDWASLSGSVVELVKSRNGFSPTKKQLAHSSRMIGFCFSLLDKINGNIATTEHIDLASMTWRASVPS